MIWRTRGRRLPKHFVNRIPLRPGETSRAPEMRATYALGQRASFWIAAAVVVYALWTSAAPAMS
jgi:hypothetical protein